MSGRTGSVVQPPETQNVFLCLSIFVGERERERVIYKGTAAEQHLVALPYLFVIIFGNKVPSIARASVDPLSSPPRPRPPWSGQRGKEEVEQQPSFSFCSSMLTLVACAAFDWFVGKTAVFSLARFFFFFFHAHTRHPRRDFQIGTAPKTRECTSLVMYVPFPSVLSP